MVAREIYLRALALLQEQDADGAGYDTDAFETSAPHLIIWPGMCIVLHVVIFNLLGDSLRDILDPRYEKAKKKRRKMKQWQTNV